ncbi:hypothetical protein EYF80_049702 [Liparis tanakae]|uniref:Uncharacterized protein n=1 Tax=Liparis tanakae TaxID=230148 RepID=A0A4Z2FGS4_9TELE|nr:hypothetical protein EYF80_049702 [Liparis tanakae]
MDPPTPCGGLDPRVGNLYGTLNIHNSITINSNGVGGSARRGGAGGGGAARAIRRRQSERLIGFRVHSDARPGLRPRGRRPPAPGCRPPEPGARSRRSVIKGD